MSPGQEDIQHFAAGRKGGEGKSVYFICSAASSQAISPIILSDLFDFFLPFS